MSRRVKPAGVLSGRRLSRRSLLTGMVGSVAALSLAACADDEPDNTATPEPEPEPTPTAVLVEAVPGFDDPTRWEGRTLTVTSWGGEYQEAQHRAFFEPFQRLTGADVQTALTDIAVLRTQVDTGQVTWDVCDVLNEDVLFLANLNLISPIDYEEIDTEDLIPEALGEHGLASSFHSTILAYREGFWEGGIEPASWADFWDVERFPGSRGLHRNPQTTLEFALLADGVAMDELYPLDVERALASLERLREHLLLWWEQGAQPTQMMASGDIDLVSVWNSRIDRLSADGAPVVIQWNQAAISGDSWVLPNGSENLDVAMDFLRFVSRPEPGAAFSSLVPFGPINERTFDLLNDEYRERLPTSPALRPKQFFVNHDWWYTNREATVALFEEWLATIPE
jgi:putative spermidine/putrescine transport system substrate-binding protein